MFVIREDDLSGDQTRALLALHLTDLHTKTPPSNIFALDLSGLQAAGVAVWSSWSGDRIAGIGALKMLDRRHAEIKSMRTHPESLRRGAAAALLDHLIATARSRGVERLSLETGTGPAFEPALALYRKRGIANGEAFRDYAPSDFNQFMHMDM